MEKRTEKDYLGEIPIPIDALYGIHSERARRNFPGNEAFRIEWYKAMGMIKLAYYESIEDFTKVLEEEYPKKKWNFYLPGSRVLKALQNASRKVINGEHFSHFIVPGLQGGAGTSINMNINEIIANTAIISLGGKAGDYHIVDPIEDANLFQSTNDTVPSALRIASMTRLMKLEKAVNELRAEFEKKEKQYRNVLRPGYTQYQEAVPSSYGKLFSTYSDALSRDWWRISKGLERIKTLNIGGSAIGTGLTVPRYVIMLLVDKLQGICNLPISRADNNVDATANNDDIVELHGLVKSLAVNLEKIASDIRLISSEINSNNGLSIPPKQAGSSIMPGKINPVIPEFVISASHQVYANDVLITGLASQGSLELNPYLPQIGIKLLNSIEILTNSCKTFADNCVKDIKIDVDVNNLNINSSPSICTALIPIIGYSKARDMAAYMKENKCSVFEANRDLKLIDSEKLEKLLKAENLLKQGFSIRDL